MKTDKNTVIGFVLIGLLFIGYFYFTNRTQQALMLEKQHQEDSIDRIKALTAPQVDANSCKTRFFKTRFYCEAY